MDRPLRQATVADIPELMRIRAAVKENRLVSRTIGAEEVAEAIGRVGRGWVVDGEAGLAGFAIGNVETGNVWALFVDPAHEGRGIGRALHDAMVAWLFAQGLARLHLSTDPGTRAEAFYRRAGWRDCGPTAEGEMAFELLRPTET